MSRNATNYATVTVNNTNGHKIQKNSLYLVDDSGTIVSVGHKGCTIWNTQQLIDNTGLKALGYLPGGDISGFGYSVVNIEDCTHAGWLVPGFWLRDANGNKL